MLMVRKIVLSIIAVLAVSFAALAQNVQVTGTVKDANGAPIVGATVSVENSTMGTTTGVNGDFKISAPSNGTLVVSFSGYKEARIAVANRTNLNVVLEEDTQSIDDVLVVAYGTTKKSALTGAVSSVSAADLKKLQVSNVTKALEGAAPGVQVVSQSGQPGSSATIRIRGIGSINASSSPLYVVDGMPYDGNISAINPTDIESMTVLKDAASTALYGSRAANGVIMITTKKGAKEKTRVTFEARLGVNSRGIPEYDIMKDPGEYMTTYWTVLKNQLGDGAQASANLFGDLGYNPFKCDNGAIVDANGKLTSAALKWTDDWAEEALQTGMRQEYNVSLQGGNSRASHYLSFGYLDDQGIIANSDYTRFSIRANGDYQVNDFISVNGSVSYARGEQNSQAISSLSNYVNTFMFTQSIAPIYPVYGYDENGNLVYDDNGNPKYDFGDGEFGARTYGSNQNVVASDAANMNRVLSDNFSGRFGVDISFLKHFKLTVNGGYDLTNSAQDRFQTPSFGDAQQSNGRAYKYRTRSQTLTVNELLSYTNKFGRHNLDVLVGHENYDYGYSYLYNSKSNFFDPLNPEYSNAITMEDMSSYTHKYTLESYLARVNYDFDERYFLSASYRRDGSSRFAKDNRWGNFWSVGGSWRISKEAWMENSSDWLNNLSLRASYGSVGNDAITYPTGGTNYYAYKTQYSIMNSDGSFSLSKYYEGNPDLTWETSYNLNVGLSASLWNNLVDVDVEYFNKRTVDMLYNMPQAISSGISYLSTNALTMKNTGVEFTLGVNLPMPEDFTWNWTFTGTHYKNQILDIPEAKEKDGITHSSYYNYREGKSVYDFYYYSYAGVNENGKSTWWADKTDENGEVVGREAVTDYSKATKYYIGTAIPDFQGGINMQFGWKNIDFSVAANYQIGGDIYDSMYASFMHAGSAGDNWHRDILNAWSETNKDSNIPILDADQNANTFSDRFLIDASYFNIRNITLGYTFPKKWMQKLQVENARIYVVADNVALFSKRKGMDPRQYISGQSQANYSAIRTISAGLSLTF